VAFLKAFGAWLPARRVSNEEIAARVGCDAAWIRTVSGIEERRFAGDEETVAQMAVNAARDCLDRAGGVAASGLGMILVSSGSAERRFPGPAASVAHGLGLAGVPAIDLPIASAGSLFGLALAAQLTPAYGNVLVVASEKMSPLALREPVDRNVAVLFGDGAGACLVAPGDGAGRIVDSALYSDGAFAADLELAFDQPIRMNGLSVILQASRKLPRAIADLLAANGRTAAEVDAFLLHQANRNLLVKLAQALQAPESRFPSNIARYGNTSSASLLIVAAEWSASAGFRSGVPVVMAAFGAGFHWGAILVEG